MKTRNIILGCVVLLVLICLGSGVAFYFAGKTFSEGPYQIAKRPMPTASGDQVDLLLPPKIANFTREDWSSDNGALATYTDGADTLQVKVGVYPDVDQARSAVGQVDSETQGLSSTRTLLVGPFEPNYVRAIGSGIARMAWSRGKYYYDVQAPNEAALDRFMQVFPY